MVLALGALDIEDDRRVHEEVLITLVVVFHVKGETVDTGLFRAIKDDAPVRIGFVGSDGSPGIVLMLLKSHSDVFRGHAFRRIEDVSADHSSPIG